MPCCKAERLTEQQRLYEECTFLTASDILRIDRLLRVLDEDNSGEVGAKELRRLPELVYNPFGDRIERLVDIDGSGELSTVELIDLFSMFSFRATSRAKAQIMFCIFDFDEDGELGLNDVQKVLQRMMMIPRESIKMGGKGGDRMISRLAMQKGSPEELLNRFNENIEEWAAEIIKEVDTTGTGTITYDEWEENVCAIDCFHDFASFVVASDSSIERTQKRLEALRKRSEQQQKRGVKKRDRKRHRVDGKAGDMKFVNPIASGDFEDDAEQSEASAENSVPDEGTDTQSRVEAQPQRSPVTAEEQAVVKIQAVARGKAHREWGWADKYPKENLLLKGKVDLLELIGSVEFNYQLLEQLEPRKAKVGEVIVDSHTRCAAVYFIASGKVGVAKNSKSEPFSHLAVGDVFGERAIISGQKTEAAYIASEGTGSTNSVKMFILTKEKLFELLDANPDVRSKFLAPPEVRIATKLRSLREDYLHPTFQATRPPALQQRLEFYSSEEHAQLKIRKDEEEHSDSLAAALGQLEQLPGSVIGSSAEVAQQISKRVPDTQNILWTGSITHVQSKFGRGVSTTFQLQRWISAQNLRVALVWIVLVIGPRQFALYRYCDDDIKAVYQGGIDAECSSKLSADAFGFVAADFETADAMQDAAFTTPGGQVGDRAQAIYQHSAYSPAMGQSFYLQHFTIAYTCAVSFIYWTTAKSVLHKMHEVLSGLPVLGSGTESVGGFQSKTDGYFSVLAQYDFSVSEATSVANIQDGIYTHLEVLTAARKKKARKLSGCEILRQWIGWLCYMVLFGLCGTCIYLILAEDWVQDQCCPCGCASCERLPAGMNGSLTNHAFHINRTRIPEFCNDPAFDCDSCLTGYKNPLLKIKNSDNPIAGIIQPLLLSITTALIPLLTKQIRLVERRADMADEMRVTLIRVFFLKMFNIGLMFGDLMQVAANSRNVCLEDTVGDLFRKMVLTDALVYTGVMLMSFVMVKTVYKGKKIEYDSIRAAQEAINVMYRQVITWVATVTSPLMPLITFVVSNYLMYIEFWALRHVFRPPERPWSAVKTVTSFMALTLLTLLISSAPSIVWMTEIRRCGPFEGIRPVDAPGIFIRNLAMNMTCMAPIDAELDEGLNCAGLTRPSCMALQAVGQCEWRAQVTIDDSIFFKGISTAGQIVTSPPFMLSIIIVAFAGIYFQNARLERWSHEVAILRETADGERKFLVKKLRTLHKRLHNEEDSPDSAGMKSSLEVKNDLQELNHMRSQHYNGVGTIPTSASAYLDQHLETKDMSAKQELSHRKQKQRRRQQKREVTERSTTEQMFEMKL